VQPKELRDTPEEAVLFAAMADPDSIDAVGLEDRHFAEPRCRSAWSAISRLRDRDVPLDPVTVAQEATSDPVAQQAMQRWLMAMLVEYPISWKANPEHYAAILRETRRRNDAVEALRTAQEAIAKDPDALDAALDKLGQRLSEADQQQGNRVLTMPDLIRERWAEYEAAVIARNEGRQLISGVPTGLPWLDRKLGGYPRGIVTLLAARAGMGKSAAALLGCEAAHEAGMGVHVVSLEDQRRNYTDRNVTRLSGISTDKLRSGDLRAGDLGKLKAAAMKLRLRSRWIVEDTAGITAEDVVRSVRRHRKRNQTALVVVDYLQHLRRPRRKQDHEEYAQIMQVFSDAAKQDDVAYLVLSQMTRAHTMRKDRFPQLTDLRGGAELEDKCKAAVFLYRPYKDVTGDDLGDGEAVNAKADPTELHVIIAKNNNGQDQLAKQHRFDGERFDIREVDTRREGEYGAA
jgi:replicative DNA helicase